MIARFDTVHVLEIEVTIGPPDTRDTIFEPVVGADFNDMMSRPTLFGSPTGKPYILTIRLTERDRGDRIIRLGDGGENRP